MVAPTSPESTDNVLSTEQLRSMLEKRYQLIAVDHTSGEVRDELWTVLRDAINGVIDAQGDVGSRKELKSLCDAIDQRLQEVATEQGIAPKTVKRVQGLLVTTRDQIEIQMRWKRENLTRGGRLTQTGLEALGAVRGLFPELEKLHIDGNQWLTAEEQQQSLLLCSLLGEVALADYWSAVAPERFAYNNHTIANLREWLGNVQPYAGEPLEDLPVEILTLPQHASLRELLFNKLRDYLYEHFYKDADNVDEVIHEIMRLQAEVSDAGRIEFMQDLQDYFLEVEQIIEGDPDVVEGWRMKADIGPDKDYPAQHQRIAMKEVEEKKQLLLADDVGGGKTGSSIASFEYLRAKGKASKALIVCPPSVLGEWEKRLKDDEGYFEAKPNVAVIHPGSKSHPRKDRWKQWQNAAADADYVLISYSMLRESTVIDNEDLAEQLDVKQGTEVTHEFLCQKLGADFLIADEAHYLRNPNGADSQRMYNISQSDSIRNGYTVLATATPVFNTIEDIAALLRMLNANQERNAELEKQLGISFADIKELTRAIKQNNTRLVRNLLSLRMLRRSTEDCLPVGQECSIEKPDMQELSPFERARYDALLDDPFWDPREKLQELDALCSYGGPDFLEELGSLRHHSKYKQLKRVIVRDVQRVRTLQESGDMQSEKQPRIAIGIMGRARGITRDFVGNNGKGSNDPDTSIAEQYIIGELRLDLQDEGIDTFILDGTTSGNNPLVGGDGASLIDVDNATMTETRQVIADFRDCPKPSVLFQRADVAGTGIDLSFVHIQHSGNATSVDSEEHQIRGRCFRKGREDPFFYNRLVLANTIEQGKWEYAARKRRIIEELLEGKPLTAEEQEMLEDETKRIRAGSILSYEAMSPRQRIMFIFNRLFNRGKEEVRDFFAIDPDESGKGKYARELAQYYGEEEHLSHAGNNRRALLGMLGEYIDERKAAAADDTVQIADIAAGTLGMATALAHREDVAVHSSDICGAMLETGKEMYEQQVGRPLNDDLVKECAMDELDAYSDGSMDIVVHSLALQYAKHHMRRNGGDERINALFEVNRVLKMDGIACIALPPNLFDRAENPEEAFLNFQVALESFFGFKVIERHTGRVTSADNPDEQVFESYMITVRKVGEPDVLDMLIDDWKLLHFPRPGKTNGGEGTKPPTENGSEKKVKEPPPGAYHQEFRIGDTPVRYETPEQLVDQQESHKQQKDRYAHTLATIQALLDEYDTFDAIPAHKLLSVPLEELADKTVDQEARDRYFKQLFTTYGSLGAIPLDEISQQSSVVLVRQQTRRGPCLVLAYVDEQGRERGYGKRYFPQEEFQLNTEGKRRMIRLSIMKAIEEIDAGSLKKKKKTAVLERVVAELQEYIEEDSDTGNVLTLDRVREAIDRRGEWRIAALDTDSDESQQMAHAIAMVLTILHQKTGNDLFDSK